MSEREKLTVYITKYWATEGILEQEVECSGNGRMVTWKGVSGYMNHAHGEGSEWCRTREAAEWCVRGKVLKKLESLRKQISKYEKMAARYESATP